MELHRVQQLLCKHTVDCLQAAFVDSGKEYKSQTKFKKLKPWATKELTDMSKKNQDYHKKCLKYPDNQIRTEEYKKINNRINKLRNKLKKEYMEKKADYCISKKKPVWIMIKEAACTLNSGRKEINGIEHQGNIYSEEEDIANIFNDFYIEVGPTLAANIKATIAQQNPAYLVQYQTNSMFISPVSLIEVKGIIQGLTSN